jgi:hypothetical protein
LAFLKENVLDDDNVGRLQLALTNPTKNKLLVGRVSQSMQTNYPAVPKSRARATQGID